ncbi:hypothetical protein [Streptomyces sp. NPDC058086]|uniref:hypothetical protein n=1 Tax=Streptomyces sp. NPDC058086 TaxID=3346334 RepID=UPI0036E0C4E5
MSLWKARAAEASFLVAYSSAVMRLPCFRHKDLASNSLRESGFFSRIEFPIRGFSRMDEGVYELGGGIGSSEEERASGKLRVHLMPRLLVLAAGSAVGHGRWVHGWPLSLRCAQ